MARFPRTTNEVYVDIEGKIQSSTWEDSEGHKRYSFEISGDNFVFIHGKRKEVKEDEGTLDVVLIKGKCEKVKKEEENVLEFRFEVSNYELKPEVWLKINN